MQNARKRRPPFSQFRRWAFGEGHLAVRFNCCDNKALIRGLFLKDNGAAEPMAG